MQQYARAFRIQIDSRLLDTIVETMSAELILLDDDLRIRYVSVGIASALGETPRILAGKAFCSLDTDYGSEELVQLIMSNTEAIVHVNDGPLEGSWRISSSSEAASGYRLALINFKSAIIAGPDSKLSRPDRFRHMVESARQGIWIIDARHRISYVNRSLADMIGYTPREMLGCDPGYFVDKQDYYPPALERRRQGIRERRFRSRNGRLLWVLESCGQILDSQGVCHGITGMITDISLRKQSEEALRTAHRETQERMNEQLSRLCETEQELIRQRSGRIRAETALSLREQVLESVYILATNSGDCPAQLMQSMCISIASILRIPDVFVGRVEKESLVIISATGAVDPNTVAQPANPWSALIKCRRSQCGRITACSGSEPQSWIGVPALNHAGDVVGVIGALDVVERTFTPDEIRMLEIFANYTARELERESMEVQLRQSDELKRLGQLCSGVAHEVRNPLNAIQAIMEALFQDIGNNPQYFPYLQHIKTQVNRLALLMKELLDLGRPLRRSDMRVVAVADLTAAAVSGWREVSPYRRREVKVLMVSQSAMLFTRVDCGKLNQILHNLLDNACEHSSEDQAITVEVLEPEGKMIRIAVVDTGCGVPTDVMARMFEPFFTTRKNGTGLGLSIVKRMVELHGGAINIRNNTPRLGLTVEIRLPLWEGNPDTEPCGRCEERLIELRESTRQ